ncbi:MULTISPECIES: copper resistance protein B [Burkholderia cepacia complex]|jgi:copper resistance protein B|uniref:Copper resistance protein B n=1 Tax=Burkholderia cenocepacia TaxID=95486 RepID=A0ABD4UFH5_9BURK|nr:MULTISPECIES: copper resistance protein B [Burkholderia cepacia complex]MCW3696647.1 copper resistance protein B [Burkholderia cenocepacia]MCW3704863.1 copper resistance protein B [Burkholderia cenocepacia]MCW3713123.1 copper resistance protein B [Burkholderia cenocepacia]MCW3725222.1 copper resistance protein B [Burkholderia cenocepacia]MCW3729115.1 copper resistance protein B [Burkholderia cenocepacia]
MLKNKQYGKFAATALTVMYVAATPTLVMAASSESNQLVPMGDSMMQPSEPLSTSVRTPVPPLTDEDRKAVFTGGHLHDMGDKEINYLFLLDNLEWQNGNDGGVLNWNGTGWVGGDIDRLWLRSEGRRTEKGLEDAEVQALWGHSISPWWDVVGGVRHNFKPGKSQTWGAIGIQGLALYNFETQATAFVGQSGQTSVRLEGTYDFLITNRLILQPSLELNVYGKSDAAREQGAGLANSSLGLRLRYEVDRQFSPYIGVTWDRSYGNTARFVEQEGGRRNEVSFVAGVRVWF